MTWDEIAEARAKGTWLFWSYADGYTVRIIRRDYRFTRYYVHVSSDAGQCEDKQAVAHIKRLRIATAQDLLSS